MIQFAITPKTDMWANDYARDMKRKLVGDSMNALDRVVGQFNPTKTYEWVVKNLKSATIIQYTIKGRFMSR